MKVAEFIKRYEGRHFSDGEAMDSKQSPARQRAGHLKSLHAGTPYEWEDLERYQRELDQEDRPSEPA